MHRHRHDVDPDYRRISYAARGFQGATLLTGGTGAQVLDEGLRIIAPETGLDVTGFHVNGAKYTLELARIVGARRAYLKGGSPSCDREGVTGEALRRAGITVMRVS